MIGIITVLLPRDQNVQGMVDIVIPLRAVGLNLTALCSLKIAGLIAVVFEDEVDMPIGPD